MLRDLPRARKRLGRMRRGQKLGILIPLKGEESAGKGKSEDQELEEQ